MSPGDRIDFDDHQALSCAITAFLVGGWATAVGSLWLAVASLVTLLAAVGFMVDCWLTERRIKRQAREDMRRRG
ncbi:hypothetical protein [Nocardia fusca]|uniref:DUF2892 domain-containing protein n=1 Tax=Nocardia fusca TaxID=941183 RepID=A0ABV3FII6_9NOCA